MYSLVYFGCVSFKRLVVSCSKLIPPSLIPLTFPAQDIAMEFVVVSAMKMSVVIMRGCIVQECLGV